jgi:hypothetical protein
VKPTRWKWAATITVDGAEIDLALEYTPGDRLIHAEADGEALIVKVEAKAWPAPDHARRDPRCPGPARAHRASGAAHDRKGAAGYVQVPPSARCRACSWR